MANSKKHKKQPKNPTKVEAAEIKQKPKEKTEVRSVSDAENGETSVKNLLIIIGIIVLLVVALILAGLFVSSLTNQGNSTADSSSTESVASSEEVSSSTESTETVSSEESSSVESTESVASSETSSIVSTTSSEDTTETTDTTGEGSVNGDGISYDMPTEFSYAAARNEGVSHQARKAIRDYLNVTGNSLSLAQRLFMEVTLQNSHNPVYMEIGEGRIFTLGEMDSAFASASALSSYQISAWQNQVNAAHYTGII